MLHYAMTYYFSTWEMRSTIDVTAFTEEFYFGTVKEQQCLSNNEIGTGTGAK